SFKLHLLSRHRTTNIQKKPDHNGLRRLPLIAHRNRFLLRMRAPTSPDETRRAERWLATARVFRATSALVATWLHPSELTAGSSVPWWLLRLYIADSVVVMLLVRWRRQA